MNNIQNNLRNLYRDQIEKSQQTTLENSVESLFEKGKKAEIGEIRVYGGVQYVKHAEGWVYAKKDGSHGIERPGGKRETAGEHHITHHKEHTSKKEEVNPNKKSEKDQSISLREKLIKQGFSPEEAKKQVSGNEEKLDKDLSIHEDSKKIAEASGMSESEYKTLHSDTKKQLLDSYNKNNS